MPLLIKDMVTAIRNCGQFETNSRGNKIARMFLPDSRYSIDFADDFRPEWEQFDTRQGAEYFGVWLNRTRLLTLTYCEGDWTLVECPDFEHYKAEVEDCIRCYEAGCIARCIDANGNVVEIQQDRAAFIADEPAKQIGLGDVLSLI